MELIFPVGVSCQGIWLWVRNLVVVQVSGVAYSVWAKPMGSETLVEQSRGVV